jgi:hypothetical protein
MFTGEILHLRDIEKAFGKDSLKMLNTWEQHTLTNKKAIENQDKLLRYFREGVNQHKI